MSDAHGLFVFLASGLGVVVGYLITRVMIATLWNVAAAIATVTALFVCLIYAAPDPERPEPCLVRENMVLRSHAKRAKISE